MYRKSRFSIRKMYNYREKFNEISVEILWDFLEKSGQFMEGNAIFFKRKMRFIEHSSSTAVSTR